MKAYITQYALSRGIYEIEAKATSFDYMIRECGGLHIGVTYHKPHWHETREAAIEQAEKMRVKKIESLKKQIEKLEKLKFE